MYDKVYVKNSLFEFDYLLKTMHPFLMCFKETIFRLKLWYIVTTYTLKQYIW